MRHTKFSFRMWRWTGASENLFALNPIELAVFQQFVTEASE